MNFIYLLLLDLCSILLISSKIRFFKRIFLAMLVHVCVCDSEMKDLDKMFILMQIYQNQIQNEYISRFKPISAPPF